MTSDGCVLCLALLLLTLSASAAPTLVIHEWGTFTSLQDEHGQALGGINTDDEPVPPFVHHAGIVVYPSSEMPNGSFKGFPRCDLDVTMRLETPVLYFHPGPGSDALQHLTVSASFPGGVLSEFYPQAIATISGVPTNTIPPLRSTTTGTLTWPDLNLAIDKFHGDDRSLNWHGPATTDPVWTSPRAVDAADISTTNGEFERFLFYRGVAHLDSPISVTRDGDQLALHTALAFDYSTKTSLKHLWLVDIAPDGTVAFHALLKMTLPNNGEPVNFPSHFRPADYSPANRDALRASLRSALVADGLYADEADALLNTWQTSYFKSPGLRLFFLVPRTWTDAHLPLKVSTPADITRVMVGRIEIVTPRQRELLHTIAQAPTNTIQSEADQFFSDIATHIGTNSAAVHLLLAGTDSLKSFGVTVPPTYQSYLDLGRFRNALILEAARENPTPSLNIFIATYGLRGYAPAGIPSPTETAFY